MSGRVGSSLHVICRRREVLRALLKPVPTRLMVAEGVEVTNDGA